RQTDNAEIRVAIMQRQEKPQGRFTQSPLNVPNQPFPRTKQFREGNTLGGHTFEFRMECRADVQWGRLQQLVRWTVRGSHIHQESPEQLITHALKPVELMNIKQVPWVLPVQCRNQLPGVKIRESNHLHLSE